MLGKFKALLDLGRVSNLPTVWSNCLAAWVLAGAGFSRSESMGFTELEGLLGRLAHMVTLPLLCIPAAAASLLYVGGTALNDAIDARFDRDHRPERPIPSGVLRLPLVWAFALVALAVGTLIFLSLGLSTGDPLLIALTLGLAALIVLYDWMHKRSVWAAVPMGGCRLLLYVLVAVAATHVTHIFTLSKPQKFSEMTMESVNQAASASATGQLGAVLIMGAALFVYIVVLTLSARAEAGNESLRVSRKAALLLYLPVVACGAVILLNEASARQLLTVFIAAAVFMAWTRSAVVVLHDNNRDHSRIGIAVSRLLAGICLIDALAAAAASPSTVPPLVCLGFFVLALLLQRCVPGT